MYLIMDGRAHTDIDRALVMECCDTLKEAKKNAREYGEDSCIVDSKTMEIVYAFYHLRRIG